MDEQLGFPQKTNGHKAKPLPGRDIVAAARQREAGIAARKQALAETRQSRAMPATRPAHNDIEDDLDGNEDEWEEPRMPVVSRRYDSPVPRRSRIDYYHNTPYQAPAYQAAPKPRRQLHVNWLVYVGIALIAMLVGYFVLTDLSAWWQTHQDDSNYGNPRTFQIDAVVGHNDSNNSPSHFIALNLRGRITVTEAPGGDMTKAIIYHFPTVVGNAGNPPVTISFQDFDNDGKPDMIVKIGDSGSQVTYMMQNNGSQFVNKS